MKGKLLAIGEVALVVGIVLFINMSNIFPFGYVNFHEPRLVALWIFEFFTTMLITGGAALLFEEALRGAKHPYLILAGIVIMVAIALFIFSIGVFSSGPL